MDDLEVPIAAQPPDEPVDPNEGDRVFADVTERTTPGDRRCESVNFDSVTQLEGLDIAICAARADDDDGASRARQDDRLLPDASIERNREVLDQHQHVAT